MNFYTKNNTGNEPTAVSWPGKSLIIMRCIVLFWLLGTLQAIANLSYSQSVRLSLEMNDATVREVLSVIERKSDFYFTYNSTQIEAARKISVHVKNRLITDVLDEMFAGQNVNYTINDKHIVLYKDNTPPADAAAASPPSKRITGKVSDIQGEPIIGANVIEKANPANGTITDADGTFALNVPEKAVLVVSFIGYHTLEIAINGQSVFNITLSEDMQALEEVVVVGYGTQKKINLTGAVSSVSRKELDNRPITSLSAGIQGLAPGVTALTASGKPGADGASFQIRGKGTLNNSNPYILVDGIETGTIDQIDPNDIESISILKDAASAAIYGSKAANGVILITTKRGVEGKPVVSYNGSYGIQNAVTLLDEMSSADYATLYNQALTSAGKSPRFTEQEIQKFRDGSDPYNYPNTDWVGMAFGTGMIQKHNVNVMGGHDKAKYMISAGYLTQEGILRNSDREQFNLRSNLDVQLSKNVSVRSSMSYIRNNRSEPIPSYAVSSLSGGIVRQLFRIAPWIPYKYEDGSYGSIGDGNPIAWLDINERIRYKNQNFSGIIAADWKVTEGLKLTGQVAYISNVQNVKRFMKDIHYKIGYHGPNELYEYINLWNRASFDGLGNYEKSFGAHNLKILLGYKAEKYKFTNLTGSRTTFPNNNLTDMDAGTASTQTNSGYSRELGLMSGFGRINYDYKGLYLFEVNLRADGSSRFSADNRWGYFPSFSAGWRISEESFMKPAEDWIQSLKIRASWGQLGNQDALTDYYPWLVTYAIGKNYPFDNSLNTGVTKTAQKLSSISWETTTNAGIGLDLLFLRHFSLSADVYRRTTKDIIMNVPVPGTFGVDPYKDNIGSVRNSGVEVVFGWNQNLRDWNLGVDANFAYNKNEILNLGGVDEMIDDYYINKVGRPYHSYYGYVAEGLFQSKEEADAYTQKYGNPFGRKFMAGDLRFKDVNGDGKLTPADRDIIGSRFPKFTFGGKLFASWKNTVDFSLLFQGVVDASRYFSETLTGDFTGDTSHPSTVWLDKSWSDKNPGGTWPRVSEGKTSASHPGIRSSFWCVSTNYLRIKNIQLGYNFPKHILSKIGISRARIFYSAENIFTFDNLDLNVDPETPDGNGYIYPNVKTHSFGIHLTF